jgi:hypothetical protein
MSSASDPDVRRPVGNRRQRGRLQLPAHSISGLGLYALGDEAADPRGDNGQRYRAELEHGLSPRAAVAKALAGQGSVETLHR